MIEEIFISFDVEADGPSPAINNCLQIGLVACKYETCECVSQLDLCFTEQEGMLPNSLTMSEFWANNIEIYDKIKSNSKAPDIQMRRLSDWLHELSTTYKIKEWVAAPSAYDWQWLNCMYYRYLPQNPHKLPFKATCISSLMKGLSYISNDDNLSDEVRMRASKKVEHTHYAVEDALEQAYRYVYTLEAYRTFNNILYKN